MYGSSGTIVVCDNSSQIIQLVCMAYSVTGLQKNVHSSTKYIPVINMSILCLWNIQLSLDWNKIEP